MDLEGCNGRLGLFVVFFVVFGGVAVVAFVLDDGLLFLAVSDGFLLCVFVVVIDVFFWFRFDGRWRCRR